MLRQALFRLFWNTYDHLGGWLLLSTLTCVASLPIVTAPAAWGALMGCAARAEREERIGLDVYWHEFKRLASRSFWMSAVFVLVLFACVGNGLFYLFSSFSGQWPALMRTVAACFFFWLAFYGALLVLIAWAFLALQDIRPRLALRRGLMVVSAHPFAVFSVGIWGLLITVPLAVSVLGAIVLGPTIWANLAMGMAGGAIEHHELIEDRLLRDRIKSEGPTSWHELQALDEREAARNRRHERSWRDILRPWDMR